MRAYQARRERMRRRCDHRPREAGRLQKRKAEDYDRALCLLPRDVVDSVLATQLKEWWQLAQRQAAVEEQFLRS